MGKRQDSSDSENLALRISPFGGFCAQERGLLSVTRIFNRSGAGSPRFAVSIRTVRRDSVKRRGGGGGRKEEKITNYAITRSRGCLPPRDSAINYSRVAAIFFFSPGLSTSRQANNALIKSGAIVGPAKRALEYASAYSRGDTRAFPRAMM